MYKCYRLPYDQDLKELIQGYGEKGKKLMESKKESIKKNLKSYVKEEGIIDFTSIQEDWFPTVESDVFISHSHKDIEVINALAGWLNEKFKVDVFVDSYIWEYCDELLKEIDEEYCKDDPEQPVFNYKKRNFSTTHVHLTLSSALNKMINKTECVIFVDTDNSLSLRNDINVGTSSAWIYSELLATRMLRIQIPERLNHKIEKREQQYAMNEMYTPLYRANVDHLIMLSANDLENISSMDLKGDKEYLDKLYSSVKKEKKVLNE